MIVGKTLAGKYLIQEQIRQQSFYDVYLAQLVNTEKRFLVKWVRKELVEPGRTFSKIKPNLMVVASMRHQGIASLRDFGEDETIFLVEDFFDGALLREVVERSVAASEGINALHALNLGIKITDALHAAHSRGIVHGQITPDSIVVSGDLSPKIADFYLLYFLSAELKTTAEFQGRDIRYCAPEIIAGSKPTFEADIYSVGIILYELLTGKPPFERDNSLSIALDKIHAEVRSPREINPEVPRLLESVILKSIKRSPESRYKNAGELLSELHLCRSSLLRAAAEGPKPETLAAQTEANAAAHVATLTPAAPPATVAPEPVNKVVSPVSQPAAPVTAPERVEVPEKTVTLGNVVQRKENAAEAAVVAEVHKPSQEQQPVAQQRQSGQPAASFEQSQHIPEQGKESVPLKKRIPKGLVPFLIAFGVFVVLAAVFIKVLFSVIGGPAVGSVVVPNLVGKSVIEAKALLRNNGLTSVVTGSQGSDEIPEGYILIQAPTAGTNVKKGREISLILSKGQEKVTVPKLVGLSLNDAIAIIEKSQLKLGEQRKELSDQYDTGIVIDQTPQPGEERLVGRPINLVVSSGKASLIITMPRITDLAADQARDILEMNNLKNIGAETIEAGGVSENTVIGQSVLEGTRVSPGQKIVMYVAAPPRDDDETEVKGIVNLNVSANEGSQEVVVMVFDRNGNREVYRSVHNPGDALKIPVSGVGKVNVKVYLNGSILKDQNL
jgi:eukaryotic-like serine/threonine-protein kinase